MHTDTHTLKLSCGFRCEFVINKISSGYDGITCQALKRYIQDIDRIVFWLSKNTQE